MANESEKPTLDQRRARHAWEVVREQVKLRDVGKKPEDAADYGREARKLPVRIVASGLGQALAFLYSKAKEKKPGLRALLADLTEWVIVQRLLPGANGRERLLENIIHGDAMLLRQATDETLAYLRWLNRFAEAEQLVKPEDLAQGGE